MNEPSKPTYVARIKLKRFSQGGVVLQCPLGYPDTFKRNTQRNHFAPPGFNQERAGDHRAGGLSWDPGLHSKALLVYYIGSSLARRLSCRRFAGDMTTNDLSGSKRREFLFGRGSGCVAAPSVGLHPILTLGTGTLPIPNLVAGTVALPDYPPYLISGRRNCRS